MDEFDETLYVAARMRHAADRESALRAQLDDARTSFEADLRATKAEAMTSSQQITQVTAAF